MAGARQMRMLGTLAVLGVLAALAAAQGSTVASFSSEAASSGNVVAAAPDYRPPTVAESAIAKSAGGTAGFIHQGGDYRVYANVGDTGNPASGVATVTASVSNVTAGQTAVPLSAGSFSVGGSAYQYRSGILTSDTPLVAGPRSYALSATDVAGNSSTQGGFSVTLDNTAPAGADVQTLNAGATVRKAEPGDTITLSYSEPIDPWSILTDWNGSSTAVVVRLVNTALLGADRLMVYDAANAAQLPLGEVDLGAPGYVGGLLGGETGTFGASGTPSTMVQIGSAVRITLGTAGGQAATTALLSSTMTWTPSSTATDRAGNAASTAATTESGTADGEF